MGRTGQAIAERELVREEGASVTFESCGEEPGLPAGVLVLRGEEGGAQGWPSW